MKILCTSPEHDESTPSMEVYDDGGYCFSCGWVDKSVGDREAPPREVVDIKDKLQRIEALPIKLIRGLQLPYNQSGYFIVWPDKILLQTTAVGWSS